MKRLLAWIRASRLPSQSYIALPLIFGQLLAASAHGSWSWGIFALVQLYGVFDQFYIVYANDYADVETDAINETPTIFSGGSRVVVEGLVERATLGRAAVAMALGCVAVAVTLTVVWQRWWSVPLVVVGLALLWAYSYPPIRLSYRGGGSLLQMLGVGVVLPLFGWHAQASTLADFPWAVLAFLLPLNLATGLSTALPDEPSDRASDKRTLAVLIGGGATRAVIIGLNIAGLALFAWSGEHVVESYGVEVSPWVFAVPVASVAGQLGFAPFARPGGKAILGFVFFALLCNLGLLGGLVVEFVM